MRRIELFAFVAVFIFAASCGGSDSPTPTPTSTATKVAASAAVDKTISAGGQAVLASLQGLVPVGMVVKTTGLSTAVDQTINCNHTDASGGTVHVTGTVTGTCVVEAGGGTCTDLNGTLNIVFDNCEKSVTLLAGGQTYNVVLNELVGGTTSATLTGSISAIITEAGIELTESNISGTLSGTVDVTGDATGSVDLTGTSYTGTGSEPTIACSGTCSVTITGAAAETCTVASDCNGCTE